jgi:pimeloyl-ACP methyl ester carboxylesterase
MHTIRQCSLKPTDVLFTGIPGVKNSLLEEFGVRLITYDRPGFGESNIHRRQSLQTFTDDLSVIADILHVDKFWLIGYSTGGIYAWAAMKYIPHRLEGKPSGIPKQG